MTHNYIVVSEYNLDDLISEVNKNIKHSYEPRGELIVIKIINTKGEYGEYTDTLFKYLQVMIKKPTTIEIHPYE